MGRKEWKIIYTYMKKERERNWEIMEEEGQDLRDRNLMILGDINARTGMKGGDDEEGGRNSKDKVINSEGKKPIKERGRDQQNDRGRVAHVKGPLGERRKHMRVKSQAWEKVEVRRKEKVEQIRALSDNILKMMAEEEINRLKRKIGRMEERIATQEKRIRTLEAKIEENEARIKDYSDSESEKED
ncbi:hypothetical protein QAD02_020510 [Eretmocerus hayati]|uniref:Uncharacterized protein n=1 Tax=Eretmocerus hayati TaxID=131215 RepID=A0ACC2PQU1_9HYME|nr:hypothetical protein QAD02_020510 [Eretmocerus hayati]